MLENRQCVPILGMGPIVFSNCSFSFNKKGIVLQEQNPSIKIRPEFITSSQNTKNKNQSIFNNNTVENNKQKMLEEFLIEICQNKTLSSKKSAQMVHISQIQKQMGQQSKTIKNQFKVGKNNQGGVFLNLLNCQITENEVSGIVIIGLQGFNHQQLNASNITQVKYFLLNQINIQNCLIKDNNKYQISFKDFKNENKIESVYPDSEYIPYIIMDENTLQVLQCEQNKNKQKTKGTCQIF
ncbi:hypothetical protein PPERSA_00317 [Pseudocohnilembus persalinus]|uniref:Uncharacterized protein n=1 Tax=Pseudocohnilembus persalinus TaxID=266149 RepID=A0A0V0QHM7_PSEPJ|nr:hypothetical protein PPERSA_00317 [Pseudocohnilembus persalinus]|eukprot:KRX01610.1 hypothetical protein PPERSA_00317 [Pseudocohnilembus persalinus]